MLLKPKSESDKLVADKSCPSTVIVEVKLATAYPNFLVKSSAFITTFFNGVKYSLFDIPPSLLLGTVGGL